MPGGFRKKNFLKEQIENMVYKTRFSDDAENDYNVIIRYLSQFYPSTPAKFKKALKKAFSALTGNPYMYGVCLYNPEYRRVPVSDYIVFYKVIEENETTGIVEIYRILHGSRDVEKILE